MKYIHTVGKKMTRNDCKIAKCKGCDIWIWTDYRNSVMWFSTSWVHPKLGGQIPNLLLRPCITCYFFQLLSLILDLRGNLPHTHTYYRTRYVVRPSGPSLTTKPTTASNTSTSKWKPWRNHEVRLFFFLSQKHFNLQDLMQSRFWFNHFMNYSRMQQKFDENLPLDLNFTK